MGTFVGASANGGNVDAITGVTWPAVQSGDLAVLVWTFQNLQTSTDPTSQLFDLVGTLDDPSCRSRVLQRVCDGTENGDVSGWLNSAVNRQTAVLYVVRGYSGVAAATSFAETAAGTSHDCPSIGTGNGAANGDSVLVAVSERLYNGTVAGQTTPPSGFSFRSVSEVGTSGNGGTYTGVADDGLVTSQTMPFNPASFTGMDSGGTAVTWTLALRPNAAGITLHVDPATQTQTSTTIALTGDPVSLFPAADRDLKIDLFVNGAWTDITADVYSRDDVVISRGKPAEGSQTEPATASMTLKYAGGKYNPRNPLGAYFGTIGRNTPIRVRLALGPDNLRFFGEVPEWPPQRDETGADAWVPIVASGFLRRFGRGNLPLETAARQYYLTTSPVAYWPLADVVTARTGGEMASGSSFPYRWVTSSISTQSFVFGNGDLGPNGRALSIATTVAPVNSWMGGYSVGTVTGVGIAGEFMFRSDKLGGELWFIVQDYGSSGVFVRDEWSVQVRADGVNNDIQLWVYTNLDGSAAVNIAVADTGPLAAVTDGQLHHIRLSIMQDGADYDLAVYLDGVVVLVYTDTGITIGHAWHTRVRYVATADASPVSVGHVVVWEGSNIPPIADTVAAAFAYAGEPAGRRIERLCGLTDTPFMSAGDLDDTLAMGYQYVDALTDQVIEVEATDMGLIYEPRASLAIGYRTRSSLYNQAAAATVDFAAGELGSPFEPVDDDQGLRNDVHAQRRDGGTFQATQLTGQLSISEPPAGVGRYSDEVTVNVQTDEMLPASAGWLLLLGTVNEARYPKVTVNLANSNVVANATLTAALLTLDVGDRIVVTNLDAFNIYDDVSLLVLGYTETLNTHVHRITFTCVPESPYQVLEFDLATSWLDPGDGTTLNEDMTTTETGMDVAVAGPLWATTGLPVSIMVGGEEMTVTAISGASSPQTFTVTRSVNGVVKTHLTGAAVKLKRPGVLGL